MATLSFSINIPGIGKVESVGSLSTEDATRLLNAYKGIYGLVEDVPGSGKKRDRTDQEAVNAIAMGLFKGMAAAVINYEKTVALKNAESGIHGIVIS